MSFYLTLPSNSSMGYHPDNSLNHYITQLPRAVELNGEWEVGLAEIQYPHSWYNVREPASLIVFDGREYEAMNISTLTSCPSSYEEVCEVSRSRGVPHSKLIRIKPGFYTARLLIDSLNANLTENGVEQSIKFHLEERQQKVMVNFKSEGSKLFMSDSIRELLGFDQALIDKDQTGSRVVDIDQSFCGLFVYCNVVEPRIVGDTTTPLLRIVPVNHDDRGKNVTRAYEKIFYCPVATKNFSSIEILIRDDTGQAVSFEFGKVTVTLHFRKVKKHLF